MRKNALYKALAASVVFISCWLGGRLNRTVVNALGGEYSLLTEFKSDTAANLMHQFNLFRNFSIVASLICAILLWILVSRGFRKCRSALFCIAVYAACCILYFSVVLSSPNDIAFFAVKRTVFSAGIFFPAVLLSYKGSDN